MGDELLFGELTYAQAQQLVRSIVWRLHNHWTDMEDLMGDGMVGLCEAAATYDKERTGHGFPAWCRKRIYGAAIDGMRARSNMSREVIQQFQRANEAQHQLRQSLERDPTEEEMAEAQGLPLSRWRERSVHFEHASPAASLEAVEMSPSMARSLSEALTDRGPSPYDELVAKRQHDELAELVRAHPDERERTILQGYFFHGHTQAQIALQVGVIESRICQILRDLIPVLRRRVQGLPDRPRVWKRRPGPKPGPRPKRPQLVQRKPDPTE